MKNMILVVGITMSMLLQVNAQNDDSNSQFKFGVKAGLNIANANGNGVDLFTGNKTSSSRLGVSIGVILEYNISDKFSVQPELYYSQQGFKTDVNEGVVKLDYINIPVMAKYYINDAFSVNAGPQVGFLLSSKYSQTKQDLAADRSAVSKVKQANLNDEDLKKYFKSSDFGLNFGLTYQLRNGFGINTSYNLGLNDIFDYSNTTNDVVSKFQTKSKKVAIQSDGDYVIKNRVFQVNVFYTF